LLIIQESELLGDSYGRCSASKFTQKGQYSPLSPILTAQLLCTMLEMSSSPAGSENPGSPIDPYQGKLSWKGLNIGQVLELVLGDTDRNQVCQCRAVGVTIVVDQMQMSTVPCRDYIASILILFK
jgi:hypothetical protein